jgi:hypothetical protein
MAASMAASLLVLLLGAGGCAVNGLASGPAADPANPLELNESAAASAARGDIESAWLLLERAARIAPHDTRSASPRGKIVGAAAIPKPGPTVGDGSAAVPASWAPK